MGTEWQVYWILAALFVLGDGGWIIWGLMQGSNQAMPAALLPAIVGCLGVVAFGVLAVIIMVVKWLSGS